MNVKHVEVKENATLSVPAFLLDNHITPVLHREGLMREVVRVVQSARKTADLQVDDRIELSLATDDADLLEAIEEHKETIMAETLAVGLAMTPQAYKFVQEAKVEGQLLVVSLQKA